MGQSAGRSSGNPRGQGARRKFTPEERAYEVPPRDEMTPVVIHTAPTEPYRFTPRGERVLLILTVLSFLGMIAMGVLLTVLYWMG